MRRTLEAVLQLPVVQSRLPAPDGGAGQLLARQSGAAGNGKGRASAGARQPAGGDFAAAIAEIQSGLSEDLALWSRIFSWAFVHALGKIDDAVDYDEQSRSWIDEWLLGRLIAGALQEVGLDQAAAARAVVIIKRLTSYQHWFAAQDVEGTYQLLEALLRDREMQQLLGVNRYQGVLWVVVAAAARGGRGQRRTRSYGGRESRNDRRMLRHNQISARGRGTGALPG